MRHPCGVRTQRQVFAETRNTQNRPAPASPPELQRVAPAGRLIVVDHDVRHREDVAAPAAEQALVAVAADHADDVVPARILLSAATARRRPIERTVEMIIRLLRPPGRGPIAQQGESGG
jgi:hypothetical protein